MHKCTCTEEQGHLDHTVEQHMSKSADQPLRSHQHDAIEHIGQVADCRVGQPPLEVSLLKRHNGCKHKCELRCDHTYILHRSSEQHFRSVYIPCEPHHRKYAGVDDRDRMQKRSDRRRGDRSLREPVVKRKNRCFCSESEEAEQENDTHQIIRKNTGKTSAVIEISAASHGAHDNSDKCQ